MQGTLFLIYVNSSKTVQRWKDSEIPTMEEWMLKLMQLAGMVKSNQSG